MLEEVFSSGTAGGRRAARGGLIRENPDEHCGMCRLVNEVERRMKPFPEVRLMYLPNRIAAGIEKMVEKGGAVLPDEA